MLSYTVYGGASWIPLGVNQPKTSYVWSTKNLTEGTKYLVKVIASGGVNLGEGSSATFAIKLKESSTGAGGIPGYGIESI